MTDRERNFDDAAQAIEDSVSMRIVRFVVRSATLPDSPRWPAALTGPLYGVIVITGCLTHAALLQWMPDRLAPVKPLAYGMVLAFGAFAAISGFITTRSSATATADSSAGTANTKKSSSVE